MKLCVCGNEMTKAEWKGQYVCHRCGRTKHIYMTNAEHIRTMTNEEMAEYLVYKVKCTACSAKNCDREFCMNFMREWLEEVRL